ncbi:hypothetical protein [Aeoliella mucimassa]|uniref:Uncharacterized protein n=1 Tax=Aeoliella mucimassa TaxID=2527972 RepID=A0A518ALW5_9BACT|nr:hypothetical protein [Aeoliella mucimassa]QDU55698.1 hypothetical protein Pan181_18920 [Aeoliella mucimassa]
MGIKLAINFVFDLNARYQVGLPFGTRFLDPLRPCVGVQLAMLVR